MKLFRLNSASNHTGPQNCGGRRVAFIAQKDTAFVFMDWIGFVQLKFLVIDCTL